MLQFKIESNDDNSSSSSDNSTMSPMNDQNHPMYNTYYEEPSYGRPVCPASHTIFLPNYPVNMEVTADFAQNGHVCAGCSGQSFVRNPVPATNHTFVLPEYTISVQENRGLTESGQVGHSQMETRYFTPSFDSHGCTSSHTYHFPNYALKMTRNGPFTETRVVLNNEHASEYNQVDPRNFHINRDDNFQENSIASASRPDRRRPPETSNILSHVDNVSPEEYNRYMEELSRWSVAAAPTQAYAPELSSRPSTIVKMESQEENLPMAVKVEPLAEESAETTEYEALVTTQKVNNEEVVGNVAKVVKVESMTVNKAKTVKVDVMSEDTTRTVIIHPQPRHRIWSGRVKKR